MPSSPDARSHVQVRAALFRRLCGRARGRGTGPARSWASGHRLSERSAREAGLIHSNFPSISKGKPRIHPQESPLYLDSLCCPAVSGSAGRRGAAPRQVWDLGLSLNGSPAPGWNSVLGAHFPPIQFALLRVDFRERTLAT